MKLYILYVRNHARNVEGYVRNKCGWIQTRSKGMPPEKLTDDPNDAYIHRRLFAAEKYKKQGTSPTQTVEIVEVNVVPEQMVVR